jgi:hypothetical protein
LHDGGSIEGGDMAVKSVKKVQAIKPDAAPAPRGAASVLDEELRQKISQAAYYRAQQRGFSPGYEVEDWLAAEAEIRKAT